MTRIKVVPNETPNADGRWIDCPFEVPRGTRWRHMAALVEQCIPAGHQVVAVETGSRSGDPISKAVVPLRR